VVPANQLLDWLGDRAGGAEAPQKRLGEPAAGGVVAGADPRQPARLGRIARAAGFAQIVAERGQGNDDPFAFGPGGPGGQADERFEAQPRVGPDIPFRMPLRLLGQVDQGIEFGKEGQPAALFERFEPEGGGVSCAEDGGRRREVFGR